MNDKVNEIKDKLDRAFGKYTFVADGHYYLCNGKRVGISTTGLIHQYSQEFDSETIAQRVATKRNVSVDEILEEWRIENLHSTIKGSMIHEYAQSKWEQKEYTFDYSQVPKEIDLERLKSDIDKLTIQANNFYNDYKDMYSLIGCEMYLGDEDYDECGATDQLMFNNYTQEIAVWDYKSNKEIVYKTKYNQKMKVPLQKFDDVNHVHYSLQLCDYSHKITKNTGLKIGEKMLIHFDVKKDNYTIIEPLDMMEEAKRILELRRVKGFMENKKSIVVLVIGKSGSGKSTSLRNFTNDEIGIINVLGKELPFKSNLKYAITDNYDTIFQGAKASKKKTIVIDDANYLITHEFVRKATQTGYQKFTDMAVNFDALVEGKQDSMTGKKVKDGLKDIEDSKVIYLFMHEDTDDNGNIKPKTIGNMLDNQINIQGLFTVVIRAINDNGNYKFLLKSNGQDCVKTPIGMFDDNEMENDLKEVTRKIREYYELDKIEDKKEEEEK